MHIINTEKILPEKKILESYFGTKTIHVLNFEISEVNLDFDITNYEYYTDYEYLIKNKIVSIENVASTDNTANCMEVATVDEHVAHYRIKTKEVSSEMKNKILHVIISISEIKDFVNN